MTAIAPSGDVGNKWITEDLLQKAQAAKFITSEDAELVRKADLEGKSVVAAGKELNDMPKATASTKHKKILGILREFSNRDKVKRQVDEAEPQIFLLLDQKMQLHKIVEETGYSSETVEKVYENYIRLKEKDLNHPSVPRRLAKLEQDTKDFSKGKEAWDSIYYYVTDQNDFWPYCWNCGNRMDWLDDKKEHYCKECNVSWPP
jgi:hypothetical protein